MTKPRRTTDPTTVGRAVTCTVCGLQKKPRGRDAPAAIGGLCDWKCSGYSLDPDPGHLWPGEKEFGY